MKSSASERGLSIISVLTRILWFVAQWSQALKFLGYLKQIIVATVLHPVALKDFLSAPLL